MNSYHQEGHNRFEKIFNILTDQLTNTGLEIRGCQEPRASLNAPAAPSNFCCEPKYLLFDIPIIFMKLMKMQLGSLEKILISNPETLFE